MPYKPDASDRLPADDQLIWRYMDLGKFISIVSTETLWFPTVEDLVKIDPWEGAFPTNHLEGWKGRASRLLRFAGDAEREEYTTPVTPTDAERAELAREELAKEAGLLYALQDDPVRSERKAIKHILTALRRSTYVSCWHYGNYESPAMWSQYAGHGIAIKSTVGRLKASLAPEPKDVRIAKIDYIDYATKPLNIHRTYLTKRESFGAEHEIRAYLDDKDMWEAQNHQLSDYPVGMRMRMESIAQWDKHFARLINLEYVPGIPIKVKPDVLIEEVLVAPTAAGYYVDATCAVRDKFHLKFSVTKSPLNDMPK
jgi:hypothetical protein